MRTYRIKRTLVISMVLLLAGASVAFARGGGFWGDRGCPMMGSGDRMMGPGAGQRGPGYAANLTEEQHAALEAARERFFAETETLRNEIREKRFALRDELAKPNPDEAVATHLQRELSQLQTAFDELAIRHRVEMRRLMPEEMGPRAMGRGFKRGGGYGYCW